MGVGREFDEQVDAGDLGGLAGDRAASAPATTTPATSRVPTGLARVQAFLEAISLVTDLDENDPESRARSR